MGILGYLKVIIWVFYSLVFNISSFTYNLPSELSDQFAANYSDLYFKTQWMHNVAIGIDQLLLTDAFDVWQAKLEEEELIVDTAEHFIPILGNRWVGKELVWNDGADLILRRNGMPIYSALEFHY